MAAFWKLNNQRAILCEHIENHTGKHVPLNNNQESTQRCANMHYISSSEDKKAAIILQTKSLSHTITQNNRFAYANIKATPPPTSQLRQFRVYSAFSAWFFAQN